MSLPEGWERIVHSGSADTRAGVLFFSQALAVEAYFSGVDVGGEGGILLKTTFERDALIAILMRAWKQHVHLKANPNGPPLPEDEEECRIIA